MPDDAISRKLEQPGDPRRSRQLIQGVPVESAGATDSLRGVFLVLFLLLIVAPLVELYVIIQVAQVIGGWETIGLLVIESIVGAWLLRAQGLTTLRRISQATEQGRVPGKELVEVVEHLPSLETAVVAGPPAAPRLLDDVRWRRCVRSGNWTDRSPGGSALAARGRQRDTARAIGCTCGRIPLALAG